MPDASSMTSEEWEKRRRVRSCGRRLVRVRESVSYEEAVRRCQRAFHSFQWGSREVRGWPLSTIARAIWPDHGMKSQGAAFAAGRLVRRMIQDGFAYSTSASGCCWYAFRTPGGKP